MASAFGVVALAQFATPASAITLFNETFGTGNPDQFNIGVGGTVGSNFKVTAGNVDLIGNNGTFDLYPGNGNYIDLNGTIAILFDLLLNQYICSYFKLLMNNDQSIINLY